jgi:hypothetical protein
MLLETETLVELGLTDNWQHVIDTTTIRGHSQAAGAKGFWSKPRRVPVMMRRSGGSPSGGTDTNCRGGQLELCREKTNIRLTTKH